MSPGFILGLIAGFFLAVWFLRSLHSRKAVLAIQGGDPDYAPAASLPRCATLFDLPLTNFDTVRIERVRSANPSLISIQKGEKLMLFHPQAKNRTGPIARFFRDDEGQDFAEYALILGAIAVVALAVISAYKNELLTAFQNAIAALQAANG